MTERPTKVPLTPREQVRRRASDKKWLQMRDAREIEWARLAVVQRQANRAERLLDQLTETVAKMIEGGNEAENQADRNLQ